VTGPLQGQHVLVVGRGGGIARAVTVAARDAGAKVIAAGRDKDTLAAAYAGEPAISTETVDLTDDASIAALAALTTWCLPRRRGPAAGSRTWSGTRSGCPSTRK
jgi:short-subunit dehydrogenase involved in D-alanine esterification of teichoic acids